MPKLIQIGFNPVIAKLYGADDDAKVAVSTLLAYFVDGYEHMNAYKSTGWDGKSTFFDFNRATFPAGFVDDVEHMLQARGYMVQRVCKPLPEPMGPLNPVVDAFGDDPRYDYQPETVRRLVQRGRMIARVATGGGKSRIAMLATARINRPTLFVTTRKALMHQMRKAYIKGGFTPGVMGDGEWEPDSDVNVAMIQTLISRLKNPEEHDNSSAAMRQRRIRERTIRFLETIEFVIGEEAHEAGGNSYFEFLNHCKKAAYRLALTATPFMRDSEEANMRLKAAFGPIGIDISEKLLIDRGILARPIFKFRPTRQTKLLRKTTPWQRAIEVGIVEHDERNQDIVAEVVRAKRYGLTTMILVTRTKHGAILEEMLRKAGVRVEFIQGKDDNDNRQSALTRLGAGEIDALIGTSILDVGVDVPSVGMIILAGGGKAEVAHRQRIGRGLRAKKAGPNVCPVVDFRDEYNKHLRKHAISREEIVRQTPGFAENVLAEGQDFDFRALGFGEPRGLAA